MDRITKSLLDEFSKEYELGKLEESVAFEHFTSFLSISKHYAESFDTEDVVIGGGGDTSIDGIAIFVNNVLINDVDEFNDIERESDSLDITLVFVQAERSSSFDGSKIGDFGHGVKDFLSESPRLARNDAVKKKSKIVDAIFSKSGKFRKGKPVCFMYYITTGRWTEDVNLAARREAVKQDLLSLNLFSSTTFTCMGADDIQKMYQSSKNSISVEINFPNRTLFPEMPGIEQAYLGYLPATEFLKIIQGENGEIHDLLFYDNVRHWQEWNPVNSKIKATLESKTNQKIFPLLNNGVTIVAKKIVSPGNKFYLEDYQIVNGCQTSYVLHESKDELNDNILIPIRIIGTESPEVKNLVIESTNRQTPVTDEQLFAVTEFPRKLELYFESFTAKDQKLYYERRARQFNAIPGIEKNRIITSTNLIRAFVSMFNLYPNRATRNYKALLKDVGHSFYNMEHRLEMYYVSAYALYRLESYFKSGFIDKNLKIAKYQLLLLYRIISGGYVLPRFNSKDMEKYCSKITANLWDDERCKIIFKKAQDTLMKISKRTIDGDVIRTEPFTKKILKEFKADKK